MYGTPLYYFLLIVFREIFIICILIFIIILFIALFLLLLRKYKINEVKKAFSLHIITYNTKNRVTAICSRKDFEGEYYKYLENIDKLNKLKPIKLKPVQTFTFVKLGCDKRIKHTGYLMELNQILMELVYNKTGQIFDKSEFEEYIIPILMEKDLRLVVPFSSEDDSLLSNEDKYYNNMNILEFEEYILKYM